METRTRKEILKRKSGFANESLKIEKKKEKNPRHLIYKKKEKKKRNTSREKGYIQDCSRQWAETFIEKYVKSWKVAKWLSKINKNFENEQTYVL